MKSIKDYINLLPREEKRRFPLASRGFLLGLFFTLAWVGVFGWQAMQQRKLTVFLSSLAAQKQSLQQQADAVRKELGITTPGATTPEKAVLIQSLLDERVLWSEVFKQFSQIVPKGLWFDYLEGNTTGKAEIKIKGGAFNYLSVAEFMLATEKSGYFEIPQLSYAQKAVIQGKDIVGFEIICGIKKHRGGNDGR